MNNKRSLRPFSTTSFYAYTDEINLIGYGFKQYEFLGRFGRNSLPGLQLTMTLMSVYKGDYQAVLEKVGRLVMNDEMNDFRAYIVEKLNFDVKDVSDDELSEYANAISWMIINVEDYFIYHNQIKTFA